MKLGIIKVDTVRDELQSIAGDYSDMFRSLLLEADKNLEIQVFEWAKGECIQDTNTCDAYLITGSQFSVYEDIAWINDLGDFISQAFQDGKKIIGICFGHQILAKALGGEVQKSDKGWGIGVRTFHIENSQPWMKESLENCSLLYSHQDQVTKLPEAATRIGGDSFCPNQMFCIADKVFSMQGHPEFSKEYDQALFNDRVDRIGQEGVDAANQSLEKDTDEKMVAKWIVEFLK